MRQPVSRAIAPMMVAFVGAIQCVGMRQASAQPFAETQSTEPAEAIDGRTAARRMADEAANSFENGQFEQARDLFHRANELFPAPALMLWEARALEKLGRLVEAEDLCMTAQRYKLRPDDSDVARTAMRDAGNDAERLRKRIPTIAVKLRGVNPNDPSVEVQLNGKRLHPALIGFPVPVDAGSRTVSLRIRGREVRQQTITLVEGERTTIELDASTGPSKTPTDAPSAMAAPTDATRVAADAHGESSPWYAQPALGWAGVGLGAVGLGTGIIAGLTANSRHQALEDKCTGNACPASVSDDLDSFRTYRTVSTLGYVIGGVALAAGVTVLVIAPRVAPRQSTIALRLQLTPQSAALAGHF